MARERVDSFSEAKELYGEHKVRGHGAFAGPGIHAGAVPRHGAAGQDMDGIATDFDQLRQAESELAGLHDELVAHLRSAADLAGPLGDGSSPVTGPMRKAFADRADMAGGVQAALLDYIDELVAVRVAILDTLATYQGADEEAVIRLNRHVAALEEVG